MTRADANPIPRVMRANLGEEWANENGVNKYWVNDRTGPGEDPTSGRGLESSKRFGVLSVT